MQNKKDSRISLTSAPSYKLKSHYQRCANIRNQFKLPPHLNLANFTNYSDPNFDPRLRDPTLTWDGISWLKTITNLPIIVKGILHPEDAILAVKQGVKGDCFFRIILSYRASHSKMCKVNCIFFMSKCDLRH